MQNWFPWQLLVIVCALAIGSPASADTIGAEGDVSGIVKTKMGNVMVERNSAMQALAVGSKVYQNDRIVTGLTSSVGITLNDDSRISLASSSSFRFTQFAYNPNTHEGSFIGSMLKGSLRFVTGLLGKASPQSVSVKTPSSTIGVRGTDFIVTVGDIEGGTNAQ
jgi:hypothetical protein